MNRFNNRYITNQLGIVTTALVCVFVLCSAQSFAQGCDDTPDHFIFTANTGDNYAIVVDSTSLDCDLSDCDGIGVYDGDLCVGASVFQGQWPLAITAWKDDTQTDGIIDGYISGNPMTFKIWHSDSDSEIENSDIIYESGNGTFDSGPYAKLSILCSKDTTSPVISCPADITIESDSLSDPDNTGYATATDDFDPSPSITHSDSTAGDVITRTWTATEASGNSSNCEQVITTIKDTIPPATIDDLSGIGLSGINNVRIVK